jgi:hypothetical protein
MSGLKQLVPALLIFYPGHRFVLRGDEKIAHQRRTGVMVV